MGINSEFVRLLAEMRRNHAVQGEDVIELGAQDLCSDNAVTKRILRELDFRPPDCDISFARDLYASLGFRRYTCIDASGVSGALVYDLNEDLGLRYSLSISADLVTNLGTAEHCFDQRAVFKNIHDLCRPGGVMVHALPVQGNVNHGFYNYHPRFFADLAAANNYEVVRLAFTVDYKPDLIEFSKQEFRRWDSHDLLFYAVLRRQDDSAFKLPFDGMFSALNKLAGYSDSEQDPLLTEFSPYLKGGRWENTTGLSQSDRFRKVGNIKEFLKRLIKGTA